MAFDAVLFDLDGTLVATLPDLTDAANDTLMALGLAPIADATIATFIGRGENDFILRLLRHSQADSTAEAVARATRTYREKYHAINGRKAVVFEGVVEGLEAFRAQTENLAVVTNKSKAFTPELLKRTGLLDYFKVITCGDTYAKPKPDPLPLLETLKAMGCRPQQALMIGDSMTDALAAQRADIPMLALPYGYNGGDSVQTLPVAAVVDSLPAAAAWAAAHDK